jgi:hypothetical protein
MKTPHIAAAENPPDFDAALKRASAIAAEQFGENMLLGFTVVSVLSP